MEDWDDLARIHDDDTAYQATPWKDVSELVLVRSQLFGISGHAVDDEREVALRRIHVWQIRGLVPLPVESTVLLVQAQLFDKPQTESEMAMRMIHATAVIRFVTALCDAFQPKGGEKLPMQTVGSLLNLPPRLVETRHDATHKSLPSLKRLREATEESIRWLWDNYWKDIEQSMREEPNEDDEHSAEAELRETLKIYLAGRRTEVKKKSNGAVAASDACRNCLKICNNFSNPYILLTKILVREKMILPSGRELGSTMNGAFLLWDGILQQLSIFQTNFTLSLAASMVAVMNTPSEHRVSLDPVKEAMYLWIEHILTSETWAEIRAYDNEFRDLKEQIMSDCFLDLTHWSVKLADLILSNAHESFASDWAPLRNATLETSSPNKIEKSNGEDHTARVGNVLQTDRASGHSQLTLPTGWTRWKDNRSSRDV